MLVGGSMVLQEVEVSQNYQMFFRTLYIQLCCAGRLYAVQIAGRSRSTSALQMCNL